MIVEPFTVHRNCSQNRFDHAVKIAKRFKQERGATNVRVWYDENEDYTRVEFELDGSKYTLRMYKIFAVTKDGDTRFVNERSFPHEFQLFNFFECGRHKLWNT